MIVPLLLMISRVHHHQPGVHATRLAEDLQREIWGFTQAVIDEEHQLFAHQCELSLCTSRAAKPMPTRSLNQIEGYLQEQGVPVRLQSSLGNGSPYSRSR